MPTKKDKCPVCFGEKDSRAEMCKECRPKNKPIRLGTGKGWRKHQNGYLYKCVGSGNTTYMHRYVMEKYLGRKLEEKEVVHHIDGNRENNNIENLELMLYSEHQRMHLIPRAKELSSLAHSKRWGV